MKFCQLLIEIHCYLKMFPRRSVCSNNNNNNNNNNDNNNNISLCEVAAMQLIIENQKETYLLELLKTFVWHLQLDSE